MITTINDGGETGLSEWKKIYLDSTSHEPRPQIIIIQGE